MKEFLNAENQPVFEKIKQVDSIGEFWSARQLAEVLQYASYRNFVEVMKKAAEACKNSGQKIKHHFVAFDNMVSIGSGAQRAIDDIRLSRYACYLIVQNADPEKELVALGQTYFAVQTRIQEIQQMEQYASLPTEKEKRLFLRKELTEHNKQLMATAKRAGVVDPVDYAIFQNYGYKGLYGGLDRIGIQKKKGLSSKENILDHMGSTELAANLFKATQAEEKLKRDSVKNKDAANRTHFLVGRKVRKTIEDIGGTMPENLPTEENIKKIASKSNQQLPPEDEK
ncbi:MAG: DNA damage-inducible protein D [Candidatus Pseudobacter hemicellulosilyticus]|uniref:DNA damage-inducible protein D n=1 Tax=Candidatus Pseudobacter hemicellulosilyticus TaxID=3121375 RepID=A0AAJ5WML4_9BACT|nr:MAG: DNA damage-inducible protein D [Pseudobacter sp.]